MRDTGAKRLSRAGAAQNRPDFHEGMRKMLTDIHGNAVSTASAIAVARLDEAAALLLGFRDDPLAVIDTALAQQPDFAMSHAFRWRRCCGRATPARRRRWRRSA
jgi:hypothetical protein